MRVLGCNGSTRKRGWQTLALVMLILIVACSGDRKPVPPTAAVTPTRSPTSQSREALPVTPSTATSRPLPLPDPTMVLAGGDPVVFKVCEVTRDWQKPDPSEMAPVFTNRRLGDGARPFPLDYAYYLESFYYVQLPRAISANIEWSAFSGFDNGQPQHLCDEPDVSALVGKFGAPGKSSFPWYQDLQLAGYHAVAMARRDADLIVTVEPAPGTHETAYFPYPANPAFFDSPLGFDTLQVVDREGRLLHAESRVPYGIWFERLSYDTTGQLDVIVLAGASSLESTDLGLAPGQGRMTLYWGLGAPLRDAPAGRIQVLDASGAVLLEASWAATDSIWQPLATLELPAETQRLRIETQGPALDTPWRHFVLIGEDLPLPPSQTSPHPPPAQ